MPLARPERPGDIRPRDTALHRRKRWRNLAIFAALIAMMAIFYMVTIVRIQSGLDAAG